MKVRMMQRARATVLKGGDPRARSYSDAYKALGGQGEAHRAVRDFGQEQLDPAERQRLVDAVGESARTGSSGGHFMIVGSGGKDFGNLPPGLQYTSPLDDASPSGPSYPVREGVSFTPVEMQGHRLVVMDYQRMEGGNALTYRVGLDTRTAYQVLAGVVRDPTIVRDMTTSVLEARVAGRADAIAGAFNNQGPVDVEVLDAITTGGPPVVNPDRFLPADLHLQYPAADTRAVQM